MCLSPKDVSFSWQQWKTCCFFVGLFKLISLAHTPLHHFLHRVHHSLYQNPPTPTPKPPPRPSLHSLHQLCSLYEVPKACMVVCMDLDPSLLVHTGIDVYNYVCPFRFTWCGKAIGLRISKRRAYWTSVYRTEAGFSRSVLSLAAVCSPSLRIHVCMCCGGEGGVPGVSKHHSSV